MGWAPMVKIKDFTLAPKNRGGGHVPQVPTHLPPMKAPDSSSCFDRHKLLTTTQSSSVHYCTDIYIYIYII